MASSSSSSSVEGGEGEYSSLEYTPTWVVAGVCSLIVLISLCMERFLHHLGKVLKRKNQEALFEALQKLKEELMLLGFISLLLTVFQGLISKICIPATLFNHMLPCKRRTGQEGVHHYQQKNNSLSEGLIARRHLLSEAANSEQCTKQGKVVLLSIEALHHLHIFIFVLALVHVIFSATTMILGGAKVQRWKQWEDIIRQVKPAPEEVLEKRNVRHAHHHQEFIQEHARGFWSKSVIFSWLISFFKQFYASVSKSDYMALRSGFIMTHWPANPNFDFHKYMIRVLEADFKKVVGISWYLWAFVVIFLLLNIDGWHTYFWISFLPLILLLAVGTKLEHIITRLAQEVEEKWKPGLEELVVKPSDEHFWFDRPNAVLYLIHFILFQNSFEIAFFFWIWSTYGFDSCIMEKVGYIVPRLIFGVIIQVLCSYSTLPLYALVTQMGSTFKSAIFHEHMQLGLLGWAENAKKKRTRGSHGLFSLLKGKKKEDLREKQTENMTINTAHHVEHQATSDGIAEASQLMYSMEMENRTS
ncbi:hypothetical protein AMTRI_Chr10g233520 [Amborella trichopoda]